MPVSIIVGGQFGSEGKGKISHFIAEKDKATAVVRVGGPNSGHTVINYKKEPLIFKHLPTSCIIKGVKSVLTAGHYINLEILFKEIEVSGISASDLLIDPYAVIITEGDIQNELASGLVQKIGSTGCGLGSAILNRISRNEKTVFAKDIDILKKYIANTNEYLRSTLDNNQRVIIEGTQGFGLSLLHSNLYPFSTSRDTTAAGFLSETGLSPLDVDDIIMVIRAFPIRVAGNSGPLQNETTWEEISAQSGSEILLNEFTSVSKKLRRVAFFSEEIVINAIRYNKPTKIVLNHLDYIDKVSAKSNIISRKMIDFIQMTEKKINRKINYVGIDGNTVIENNFGDTSSNITSIAKYASA
jgi:adenylosuccinate synthase